PSPQPTSSTRVFGSIMSAIACRSMRMVRRAGVASISGDSPMLGTAGDEAAQRREQFRLVEQERVMSLVALDLDEADIGRDGVQRMDDGAVLCRRKQPVAGEGHDAEAHRRVAEGIREHAVMLGRKIEI